MKPILQLLSLANLLACLCSGCTVPAESSEQVDLAPYRARMQESLNKSLPPAAAGSESAAGPENPGDSVPAAAPLTDEEAAVPDPVVTPTEGGGPDLPAQDVQATSQPPIHDDAAADLLIDFSERLVALEATVARLEKPVMQALPPAEKDERPVVELDTIPNCAGCIVWKQPGYADELPFRLEIRELREAVPGVLYPHFEWETAAGNRVQWPHKDHHRVDKDTVRRVWEGTQKPEVFRLTEPVPVQTMRTAVCQCQQGGFCYCDATGSACGCPNGKSSEWAIDGNNWIIGKTGRYFTQPAQGDSKGKGKSGGFLRRIFR